jgi:hypothetical protein
VLPEGRRAGVQVLPAARVDFLEETASAALRIFELAEDPLHIAELVHNARNQIKRICRQDVGNAIAREYRQTFTSF